MKILKIFILLALTAIICWGLLNWSHDRMTIEAVGRDFGAYWASGHLLLEGDDPYSAEKVLAVQQSLGWTEKEPIVSYNPPWALTFLLPFCMPDFPTGKIFWMICTLAFILFSADRLWLIYGGFRETRAWALLAVVTFSPAMFAYKLGQIVPLMLLGLAGFLYCVRRKNWWLAGMTLVLIAVKPHTLYLFWFALLFWAVKHRLWPVLLGSLLALMCATLPPLFYNLDVFSQYFGNIIAKSYALHWATPTVGTFLRLSFGSQHDWLQYIPALAGLIWFLFYWRTHRDGWVWEDRLPLLIFVSLMTNFYTWPSDYLMILPVVIQATVWIRREPGVRYAGWILILYVAINVSAIVSTFFLSSQLWYVWMPYAFWINYILLVKQRRLELGRQA